MKSASRRPKSAPSPASASYSVVEGRGRQAGQVGVQDADGGVGEVHAGVLQPSRAELLEDVRAERLARVPRSRPPRVTDGEVGPRRDADDRPGGCLTWRAGAAAARPRGCLRWSRGCADPAARSPVRAATETPVSASSICAGWGSDRRTAPTSKNRLPASLAMWQAALRSDVIEAATDPPKWKWSSALLGSAPSGTAHGRDAVRVHVGVGDAFRLGRCRSVCVRRCRGRRPGRGPVWTPSRARFRGTARTAVLPC